MALPGVDLYNAPVSTQINTGTGVNGGSGIDTPTVTPAAPTDFGTMNATSTSSNVGSLELARLGSEVSAPTGQLNGYPTLGSAESAPLAATADQSNSTLASAAKLLLTLVQTLLGNKPEQTSITQPVAQPVENSGTPTQDKTLNQTVVKLLALILQALLGNNKAEQGAGNSGTAIESAGNSGTAAQGTEGATEGSQAAGPGKGRGKGKAKKAEKMKQKEEKKAAKAQRKEEKQAEKAERKEAREAARTERQQGQEPVTAAGVEQQQLQEPNAA